jgi:glycosyltransferase involved in cell wall biosynthesis
MIIAVVAMDTNAAAASETVRSALSTYSDCQCEVLDLDGRYRPHGSERVSSPGAVDIGVDVMRLTHDDASLASALAVLWCAHLLKQNQPVLGLVPGVILQAPFEWRDTVETTVAVVRAIDPTAPRMLEESLLANELFLLGTGALPHLRELRGLASDWHTASRCLDLFVARVPHRIVIDDTTLLSASNSDRDTILDIEEGRLTRAGRTVVALDLVGMVPDRPWLFDGRPPSPGPLLSRNPALSALVHDVAARMREQSRVPTAPPADATLVRCITRAATEAGESQAAATSDLEEWLVELLPQGDRAPVARYLAGVWESRPDLIHNFPRVPGRDSIKLAQWATEHGVRESAYDPARLRRAAEVTIAAQPTPAKSRSSRPRGVNLVGYLSGELGIGTSARLMDQALQAARIPTSTFAASAHLQSRSNAAYRQSDGTLYDTSLLAVNADQTESVVESQADVVTGSYRIGMWYWEVESFPASRDAAFSQVDEVWAATDFVRDAVAQRATVPVRTVMPPLPQRSAVEPPPVPARLHIPADRPWFFFAFDFLSTVERKNPHGLLEAFARAFPAGDARGPVLVVKTLNADRRIEDAERLRLVAADRSDVVLIDEYLEAEELTALMANCTAYVSLHRAEGLGLTIAEAMAWGRPVVVSAYSGNMQFTNSGNAFLVPCKMTTIPQGADPYPAGTRWGDPDLDHAAALLRRIVDDPASAATVGRQAARDIRDLHSPAAAGERVREALEEAWKLRRRTLGGRLRLRVYARSVGARLSRLLRRVSS